MIAVTVEEVRAELELLEQDESLDEDGEFCRRVTALDWIEFNILGRIDHLSAANGEWLPLARRAQALAVRLNAINARWFQTLRDEIRLGDCGGAQRAMGRIRRATGAREDGQYDALDSFVAGLLHTGPPPEETRARGPDMVFYQPTPARIVLALVEAMQPGRADVFYDLGSGLGQVAILVNLLTGARARGVEFEPGYCSYAQRCAAALNLARVDFLNLDVRAADYADGTIFFMYTPFRGALLKQVLERLEREARGRMLRVATYGPCTWDVLRESWLRRIDPTPVDDRAVSEHHLAVFQSL